MEWRQASVSMTHSQRYLKQTAQIALAIDHEAVERMVAALVQLRARGGRLFLLGVGGSAANCSHAVSDFRKLALFRPYSTDRGEAPPDSAARCDHILKRFGDLRFDKPYFEDLRAVGVLWDSPEKAAAKVAAVYDDPRQWWESGPVRAARQRFVDRYAAGRADWISLWRDALNTELALSLERSSRSGRSRVESQQVSGGERRGS